MKKFATLFKDSYKELKNVRCITLAAMFGAISIVLGAFSIPIGNFLKIGFTFLPNQFVFYLFGPFVGGIFGALMDVLNFIVKPTGPFFFGFTFSAIVTGIIFGVILYQKPLSFKRIFIANVIEMILVNLLLNTIWLTMILGNNFFDLLPIRALKEVIMLPIESILMYSVIKAVEASGIIKIFNSKKVITN